MTLEQIAVALKFHAFFVASKQGKTGLTVTVDVYRNGTQIVTDAAASEIGGGVYSYQLAAGSVTVEGEYVAIFKTSDATVDFQHVPQLFTVGRAGIEHLDADISGVTTLGAGAISWPITITVGGNPVDGVDVWVSTDEAGANVIARGGTDDNGVVAFLLDAGDYFAWKQLAGYAFTNPESFTVS